MKLPTLSTLALLTSLCNAAPYSHSYGIPATQKLFSSKFAETLPPRIVAAFSASWQQHKWDQNVSHIASGYMYASPELKMIRVDTAYQTVLGSSLFDYSNVSSVGQVANHVYNLTPAIASLPNCNSYYVDPAFPLFAEDFLQNNSAVFGGWVAENGERVAKWEVMWKGVVPVTVLLSEENIVVGYDFFTPVRRTSAKTRFFNIEKGEMTKEIFEFPCK
ncbi:MAG: hypothetical protein M1829_004999 [Trizodia sp. TS-e1964]|nr:MAG: hypothetical protein M1829_004999 [Trizodia sp. TS-e1964]